MADDDRLSRRQVLIGLGALAVGGVGGWRLLTSDGTTIEVAERGAALPTERDRVEPTAAPEPTEEPTEEPSAEPTEEPTPEPVAEPLEPAPPYELVPGEVYGEAKLVAAQVVQALTTYDPGERPAEVVARALVRPRPGLDAAGLEDAVAPLIDPSLASSGRVVYPQLGGLAPPDVPTSCSVMVVTEQRLRDAEGGERTVTRTIDVRLVGEGDGWLLDGIASAGGEELARPEGLHPLAAAVADHERIDLPDSARWDLYEGDIDLRLLETMLHLAEHAPFAVATLRNGHPRRVFGTERTSNHTAGRAVDIWAIDGVPVVSQQPEEGTPAWGANRLLFDGGAVNELGGPWAFDGFGGRSFTNDVHLDHLHVAFFDPRRDEPDVPPAEQAPAPEDETEQG